MQLRPMISYGHMRRLSHIASVLIKYGFGQFLDRLRIWEYTNIERRLLHRVRRVPHHTAPERMRMALEELGPTFIKLGQILSTRPDVVPQNFINELEKLQSQVAPITPQAAKEVVKEALGQPVSRLFASFENDPAACASLSQVHRATLENGDVVAVKIQRPGIEETVRADVEIMRGLARLLKARWQQIGIMDPVELADEFARDITNELDFRHEANNMRHFARIFEHDDYVHVPRVYDELSTRRVLSMEYISGIPVIERERLRAEGYDCVLISRRGADVLLKASMEHGFFHADPHPGNIFILPDNVVCLLDYGMMGTLSSYQRESLARLVISLTRGDERNASRSLLGMARAMNGCDSRNLEIDVADFIQYAQMPLEQFQVGALLPRLWQLLIRHHLRLPAQLVWLLKAIAVVEDTGHRLGTALSMVEYAQPYARRLLRRRLSPLRQARELQQTAIDALDLIKDLPYEIRNILDQIKEGRVKVEFEHIGLDPMRKTLNRVSNRLSLAIILAALVIGSSLIVLSGLPPLVAGIPVVGLGGYILSALLALWLVASMLFSK